LHKKFVGLVPAKQSKHARASKIFSRPAWMAAHPICDTKTLEEERMAVSWNKEVDSALNQAKSQHKPVLVDFSAAPA
jgi:thiol:disulfide interchange protein